MTEGKAQQASQQVVVNKRPEDNNAMMEAPRKQIDDPKVVALGLVGQLVPIKG